MPGDLGRSTLRSGTLVAGLWRGVSAPRFRAPRTAGGASSSGAELTARLDDPWSVRPARPCTSSVAPAADEVTDPRFVDVVQVGPTDRDVRRRRGFPEVPTRWFDKAARPWALATSRPFHFPEPIHVLEGRSLLWAVRQLAQDPANHHKRHLLCRITLPWSWPWLRAGPATTVWSASVVGLPPLPSLATCV